MSFIQCFLLQLAWMRKVRLRCLTPVARAQRISGIVDHLMALLCTGVHCGHRAVNCAMSFAPLQNDTGAPPSWDNVIYSANPANATASAGLGYVDAMHQSLQSVKRADSPTVLTHYRALGDMPEGRKLLLAQPWSHWRDVILAELGVAHPDLAAKTTRIEMTRYGHAMAVPLPGPVAPAGLRQGRVSFAHSDWAGYSVFEEAFTMGHTVGG